MAVKKKGEKKDPAQSQDKSERNVKKVNTKETRHKNTALLEGKKNEQIEELMKFLFEKLKNKETQKIDRNALMKAITNLGLWNDIFEEDITDMLELFSPSGAIDYDTMKEIFLKCKINVNGFIEIGRAHV